MRKFSLGSILCSFLFFSVAVFGQGNSTPMPTPTPENEEIIRISSKLVLVDALVLDKKDNQVKDLSPEDFEVYQDGKLQKITNFSYIDGKNPGEVVQKNKKDRNAIPPPPISVRSQQARLITFVIDDGNCLSTPEGMALARDGVKKFINDKMLPSDKVAIYRTRGGSSLLQIYTTNKEVLRRAINKARWFPSGCGSAFDAARDDSTLGLSGEGASTFETDDSRAFKAGVANERKWR